MRNVPYHKHFLKENKKKFNIWFTTYRLHISGPNDERPRDSVSLDSYDDVDTNEYMNHSMENIKNTRENTDIDCSIEENYQEFIAYDQEFNLGYQQEQQVAMTTDTLKTKPQALLIIE